MIIILILNEKHYAEMLLRNKHFKTIKNQKQEKYILIKYLLEESKSDEEINKVLKSFKNNQLNNLNNSNHHDKINYSMINKAKRLRLVKDVEIEISENDVEVIKSLGNSILERLLFANLVYYKYIVNYTTDFWNDKYHEIRLAPVDNIEIPKLAGLSSLSRKELHELYRTLIKEGYYDIKNFKGVNYYYLPRNKEEDNGTSMGQ